MRLVRLLRPVLVACWLCAAAGPPSVAASVELGLLPNVSVRVLFNIYQPLCEYLERELGQTVNLSTAPGFRDFHARTIAGSYDIVVTAANLGRLAEIDADMVTVAVFEPPIAGLLVMHVDHPLSSIAELRGGVLAMANPQSLVALAGIRWLAEQGLAAGAGYRTMQARNDDSLFALLATREARLAMMSAGEFMAIREDLRASLRTFMEFAKVPGFFVGVHRRIPAQERERMRTAILRFPATEQGRDFFARGWVRGIRPVTDADRTELDPLLDVTRAAVRPD